jgi:hypothetical protein
MTDLDMWSGIVGFAVPPLVAVFVQSAWPAWARAVFAFAVCVAGGGVTAALTGYLHGMSPARSALVVLFSALTFYRVFWHPSTIAPKIEAATNFDTGPTERAERDALDPVHHRYPPR